MRTFKNLLFDLIYLLMIIYLVIYIPVFWGYRPLVIVSGSMEPALKVGGIHYYKKIDLKDFKKDDVLVYKTKYHIISHRVVKKLDDGFITKGDANTKTDGVVSNSQVLGKGTDWSIPYIGYYADYIYHHKYILVIVLGVAVIDYYYEKERKKKIEKENSKTLSNSLNNNN